MEGSPGKNANPSLFIKDAACDQNALKTFSRYPWLKSIKQQYDPEGFLSNFRGGWTLP